MGGRFLGVIVNHGQVWRFRAIHPEARRADGLIIPQPEQAARRLRRALREPRAEARMTKELSA